MMITNSSLYDFILESEADKKNIDVKLLNELFAFKKESMPDESILDAIYEFSYRRKIDPVELAQELAEIPAFLSIVEKDCKKFRYIQEECQDIESDWS